uniref:Angiotensin-converting enzyme n=1 Tax=Anopheles farauti TaxID=69004 RepID=A0A182QDG1_9DIPT
MYLRSIEPAILRRTYVETVASWAYESNITERTAELSMKVALDNAEVARELRQYDFNAFKDADLKRRIKKLTDLGYAALDETKFSELVDAISRMQENYATAKVCQYRNETNCNFGLEPELTETLAKSRDPEELKYYWVQWHEVAGKPVRKDFDEYVRLNREAAQLNNFTSGAEYWLDAYEDDTFEAQVDAAIEQIRPLYEQIHGYVRYKLRKHYGSEIVSEKGPIPIHLLGNMWGQTWDNIADITTPFPNKKLLDVTDEMVRQGYTAVKMFQMGDEFFQSLNMTKLPQTFWDKSILEKPNDGRELVCHASAWDFYKKDDVRIKQCTRINMEDFFTVHHELGHIQYYLQYQNLPSVYREGANPGFHEAVGDVLSLSVSTPKHLEKIGLLKDFVLDEESKLNQFYQAGLSKLVFLPFAYTLDKYRWEIFRGELKPENYNCKFWEMRSKYSGLEPPVVRSESDFDAAAKYHVSADVEYLRYFVSYIVQFQFHRAACQKAGEYVKGDPEKTLNNCDIYQSAEAGNALKAMLALGSSKPWPDAMEALTGQRKMSADALIEYFQPLYDWLVKENKALGAHCRLWGSRCTKMRSILLVSLAIGLVCHVSASAIPGRVREAQEQEVSQYLEDIEQEILARRNAASEANWAYDSNITDDNLDVKNEVATENAAFFKQISQHLAQYDYESFEDTDLKRRVKKLVGLGYSALPEEKFTKMLDAINNMKENYAKIKVCDYHDSSKCDLALEPELTEILINMVLLAFGLVCCAFGGKLHRSSNEQEARHYVEQIDAEILSRRNALTEAEWAYESDINDDNLHVKNELAAANAVFVKEVADTLNKYDFESFDDEDLKRKIRKLTKLGYSVLPEETFAEMLDAINRMQENYAKVKVCDYHDGSKCDLALEPELTEILATSRDPEELKYYWQQWYDAAGAPTRDDFQKYVDLNGEAARMNNYASGAEYWLSAYEDETFEEQVDAVIEELRPLYEQIHANVRHQLRKYYGEHVVSERGPIPMHLLGNMWAQTWENVADITSPFGDRQLLDVTEEMVRQGYTPIQMFEMGDEFFQSLNMTKVPQSFWEKSILEKPDDGRELVCHASAWEFSKTDDVRIKQCTRVTMDQFFTAHHELGHVQYFLQYQHLPSIYRDGANPGFHEAVGDVLSLSVSTPKHLEKIGLLKDFVLDEESKLNQFYGSALNKLVFLPFAYTLDKYRWGIFRGDIKPEEYNCKFWEMRSKYSGVEPPVVRTEADFDAPAKYHVSADVEYLRYFVSYIIQFQFHRSACELAGEYVKGDPEKTLNNCDIYQSAEAGNAIKAMLALGSSKPWPEAMEVLTGERRMSAEALIEYFQPLYDWLVVENERIGAYVGWEETNSRAGAVGHIGRVEEIVRAGKEKLFRPEVLKSDELVTAHRSQRQLPGASESTALRGHHVPAVLFALIDAIAGHEKLVRFVVDDGVTAGGKQSAH